MRDLGAMQSPMNAYFLNLGLESLHVRMPRHCENAQKVAEFLQADENVSWVNYPGLLGNKYYERAKKYMPDGTCGVVSFGVKGGRSAAEKFMAHLKVAMIATHVADAHTCVLHPASATHRQMNDEELKAIMDTAHEWGKTVTAHVYSVDHMQKLIKFGIDGMEHCSLMDEETAQMIIDNDVYVVPTFCPYEEAVHLSLIHI